MDYQIKVLEQARSEYLNQCAYMYQALNTFAEQRGGVEALNEADRKGYQGRHNGLIKLVAYDDAVTAAIAEMKDWIETLIDQKRELTAEVNRLKQSGWDNLSKEERRVESINRAHRVWADHY